MSYTAEITQRNNVPTFIEKFRMIFGLLMLVLGFYFGLFSTGIGESLGFISLMASPFVMVTEK
jgi:hypothetical protein